MLAWASSPSRIWATSVASAPLVVPVMEALAPCRASSLTRRRLSAMPLSVVSVTSSQPRPFCALRTCCWVSASCTRILIDVVASVGESEGRLRFLPVDSFSWVWARRSSPACREVSDLFVTMFWVTRIITISRFLSC